MNMHLKLSVLAGLVAHALGHAQTLPVPLVDAARTAVLASPDVQERWKAFRATEDGVDVARAAWRPQVDLTANVGQQHRHTPGQDLGTFPIRGSDLRLTQLLFDGGVAGSAIREAGVDRLRSYYDLTAAGETIALQVTQAYLDLLRHRERVALATEHYAEHRRTSDMLQERSNAAVARRSDLEQALGRLALAESELTDETTALNNAAVRYQRLVGTLPPAQLPAWPETAHLAAMPTNAETALRDGLRHNPSLRAAWQNLRARQEAVDGRQAAFLPRVELRVSTERDKNRDGVAGHARDQVAEVVLEQNLYRGGADVARRTQATALAARAQAQFEQTCREVGQTLSVAYKDSYTLEEQRRLLDEQRLAVDKTRTAFRQQFDLGQRTLLDLLDTQTEYFESQRNYLNARYDQLAAEARTLAAMGGLVAQLGAQAADRPTPQALGLDGDEHDPSAHCAVPVTFMDSLARIKAGLDIPRPTGRGSYVVLLPNADGSVGRVSVSGTGGQQELHQAGTGTPLQGHQAPSAVSDGEVQRDFGAALQAAPALPEKFTLLFDQGSTRLSRDSRGEWDKVLASLRRRPAVDITLAGHTDTVSNDRLNDALALRRAKAVEAMIRRSGFKNVVIAVESHGAKNLAVPTPPQTGEARNRRVLVTVR
ncbi:TolC family outer membrane protein [Macromonas nakdongensis]|uniref:TolC family outer membrane protein n=1 Tax=Macromonas nakdongensis TaxID=1843082 RepID=UPI000C338F0B|nr:TolC family outer membrane protein [Macromonas nakdongensis]